MKRVEIALTWPLAMTCGVCGAEGNAYPYPAPRGSFVCPNCSPSWLESFVAFATEDTRHRGFKPRTEADQ